jgi:hypothetical protein
VEAGSLTDGEALREMTFRTLHWDDFRKK